jgi:uncharacterized protein (TIGR00251 family)
MQRRVCSVIKIVMAPKSTKAGKKEAAASAGTKQTNEPILILPKSNEIAIKILAKPGSKENGITGMSEDGVEIKISAPPVDGEANTELISYLSKLLGIRKSDLSLDRGNKSRVKTVTIAKDCKLTLENVKEIIKANVGK